MGCMGCLDGLAYVLRALLFLMLDGKQLLRLPLRGGDLSPGLTLGFLDGEDPGGEGFDLVFDVFVI